MAEHEVALAEGFARLKSEGSRREFLRLAGALGGALAFASMAACSSDDDNSGTGPTGGTLALDFAQPLDVLKYAFALEALEADFYTKVVANAGFNTAFTDSGERQMLTDIRDHEIAHREFFRAAITAAASASAVPALSTKYPATLSFSSRAQVLATAKTFEDLGVSAYNGAGKYLVSRPDLLTIAGKIVSVEARHASALRDLISPNTSAFANVSDLSTLGANESAGLDAAATPQAVLAAAGAYVNQTITVSGT